MADLLGVILAGGLSRRMDGPEKSLLELNGKTLVSIVADNLKHQTENIIVNANGDPKRFSNLSLDIQPDTVDGFVGPLAGVLAGMRWAQNNTSATHVITAAADTPFFPKTYVGQMLASAVSESSKIALAASNSRNHPVFGLWPVSLADDLESFLVDEENRKVMLFVKRYSNCQVNFQNYENGIDPFFNVNTPDDMQKAQEISLGLNNE